MPAPMFGIRDVKTARVQVVGDSGMFAYGMNGEYDVEDMLRQLVGRASCSNPDAVKAAVIGRSSSKPMCTSIGSSTSAMAEEE